MERLSEAVFEWDDGNRDKCRKHGVSLAEIEFVLTSPDRKVGPDIKHSDQEQRFLATGRSQAGRPMFVVFTLRGQLIRPLSARYMHAKEAQKYEENS